MIISLDVSERYLAVQLVQPEHMGDVRVYRLSDLSLVASLTPTEEEEPLGVALVGDRLLVQWEQRNGDGHRLVSKAYDLDDSGAHLASERLGWNHCCGDNFSFEPVRIASFGNLAVLSPLQHVVTLGAEAEQEWIRGVGQGSFARPESEEAGQLLAIGPYAAHALDMRNPGALALISGGPFDVYDSRPHQWFVTGSGELHPLRPYVTTGSGLSLVGATPPGLPRPLGPLELASAQAPVEASGNSAMQVSFDGGRCRLSRYVMSGSADRAQPRLLATWDVELPSGYLTRDEFQFSYDAASGQLAIVELRFEEGQSRTSLSWLAEEDGAMHTLAHSEGLDGLVGLKLAAGKLAWLSSRSLRVLEPGQGDVQIDAEWQIENATLLDFDGQRSYLAGAAGGAFGLVVFEPGSAGPLMVYPTVDIPRNVAVVGDLLAIGMDSAISLAAPACLD